MILKEKGRRECLIIIFQLNMFCGWDVLYLLHQPVFMEGFTKTIEDLNQRGSLSTIQTQNFLKAVCD
jgi:hypothetical protein